MAPDGQIERHTEPSSSSSNAAKSGAGDTERNGTIQAEHCYYCFDVLEAELSVGQGANGRRSGGGGSRAAADVAIHFDGEDKEYPLFVTWNILPATGRKSAARLRGCIGTFSPLPLAEGLRDYAITSAFHDSRFSPIRSDEVPRLECGVSLLTAFEECEDYLDWDVGTHGIYIYLPNPNRNSSRSTLTATYLPDVMPAQGWSKTEAIDSAIQKAGWNGAVDEAMRRSLRVRRYQSEKITVSYDDWQAWKDER